ncbi:hypothetical protein EAO70_24660, partial [Streptomyces sp. adm13(2018)]|uniref:SCO7613 C-terminal domain-containing membrane protein n=1 Tax=Streptomyces sp. adm13(2018) TaxID=2479007 RepID=UPI0011CE6622
LGYTAVAAAVLAGAWTAYGAGLSRLRIPLPAAVVAGQLPLPLGVLAAGGGPTAFAWAALATAAADGAVILWTRPAAVRITAAVGAATLGGWALLTGGWLSLVSPWSGAPLLLAAAAIALFTAWRTSAAAVAGSVVAGLAVITAVGGLLRAAVPSDWTVPVYVLCGLAVASVWRAGRRETAPEAGRTRALPAGVRLGLACAGAGVAALGVVWSLPPVAAGLLGPLARTTGVWSGEHAGQPLASFPGTAALVLAVAAVVLAAVPRLWARCGALALTWALLTALPVSLGLPYAATLTLQLLTTAAALAGAVRPGPLARGLRRPEAGAAGTAGTAGTTGAESPAATPAASGTPWGAWVPSRPRTAASGVGAGTVLGRIVYGLGLGSAVSAVALSLDSRGATFTALGALLVLLGGTAAFGTGARRVVAACAAVLTAAGLVLAAAAAGGFEDHWTALALLGVTAAAAAVGAKARPVALPVEITGAALALPAFALAAPRPAFLALTLALGGVVAAATAVRPERRRFASWTAAALFLLAAWVRLAAWEVTIPEAYTLPVTVPALAVGFLRRRRDPEASSWAAYGPGLAATLLPSLVAAWTDPEWARPLALGLAALAVTLLGARFRLQALLVLGGAVLALDGLHELAPYVVQAVGALPRWLPPALAGLLLLAVGATYEQRLRDARRLRDRVARMR